MEATNGQSSSLKIGLLIGGIGLAVVLGLVMAAKDTKPRKRLGNPKRKGKKRKRVYVKWRLDVNGKNETHIIPARSDFEAAEKAGNIGGLIEEVGEVSRAEWQAWKRKRKPRRVWDQF